MTENSSQSSLSSARISDKAAGAYRTISEVANELELPQHVLRFWESRFGQIRPLKRGGGRRYYRPEDISLLKGIQHLLYNEGYTIKGVQKLLKTQGARAVQEIGGGRVSSISFDTADEEETLNDLPSAEITPFVRAEPVLVDVPDQQFALQDISDRLPLFSEEKQSDVLPQAVIQHTEATGSHLAARLRLLRDELSACRNLIHSDR